MSPVESDVIAVSTLDPASTSTNSGVVQIRAGALQPQMVGGLFTATRIGPLAYDGNGAAVFGYDDVTTGFALHAMSVLGDGLLLTNQRGIDMGSFVTVASPAFSVDAYAPPTPDQLVPGAAGQVAMRFGSSYTSQPATDIWLFTSPQLQ